MRENRFQINVATGRMTLPVAILFCLMIWVMSLDSWKDLGTLGITVLTGYLMIETNTAFSLIRTRTSLQVGIYWCLFSALVFLHSFEWSCFAPLAFLMAVMHLYRSYESLYASTSIFHAFFFLAIGSLGFPQLLFFVPLFLFSTFSFRSLSLKSFFGGLLGIVNPYWILFGYAYWKEDLGLFLAPYKSCFVSNPLIAESCPCTNGCRGGLSFYFSWCAASTISNIPIRTRHVPVSICRFW